MKIICISDTHGYHKDLNVPDGDLLIFAGDYTNDHRKKVPEQLAAFNSWLGELPHKHKVMIAGNHDFFFEDNPKIAESFITNAIYLNDSGIEIEGLKIWGSPVQPTFYDWAFNKQCGEEIKKHWSLIPEDTDILVTHGPPAGILDLTDRKDSAGCKDLYNAIKKLGSLKLHIFGHIHEAYGQLVKDGITYINPSKGYHPICKQPIMVDLC